MKLYSYDGPVLEFDRIIANHWKASTRAESEKKARSNLAKQFKDQYGKSNRFGRRIFASGTEIPTYENRTRFVLCKS